MPAYVHRQSVTQGLLGEEIEAAVTGLKPVEIALEDAERWVNGLLARML